jgi:Protein of unknown function (DUF3039)
MTDTDRSTLRRVHPRLDEGDSAECAHIVMKGDQLRGYVAGEPIVALCGKSFVPSRDYEGLPVCQACQDERDRILSGMKRLN